MLMFVVFLLIGGVLLFCLLCYKFFGWVLGLVWRKVYVAGGVW